MCVVNDSNPRRRHRPAYLAPARLTRPNTPLHNTGVAIGNDEEDGDATNVAMAGRNVNDNDDGTIMDNMFPRTFDMIRLTRRQQQQLPTNNNHNGSPEMEQYTCRKVLSSIYLGLIDCVILSMVMIMSFFFYDVEVTIVKSHPQQQQQQQQRSTHSIANPSRFQQPQQQPYSEDISGSRIVWRRTAPPPSSGRVTLRSTTDTTTTPQSELSRDTDGTTSMGGRSTSTTTTASSALPHPTTSYLPFFSLASSSSTTAMTTTRRGFQDSIV
jgi:hypothetical protein